MSIQTLNGVSPKRARQIAGNIYTSGLATAQHPVVTFSGRTYPSPFTTSAKSVFPTGRTVSTQPALAALQVESPGKVVRTAEFVKVHPHEKGSTFLPTTERYKAVRAAGGPSKAHDTPATPNSKALKVANRPARFTPPTSDLKATPLSFIRSGGTIGGHADPQAGTSSGTTRWSVTKKGVAVV